MLKSGLKAIKISLRGVLAVYRDIKRRLDKLQLHNPSEYAEILELIRKGTYYDELTDEQKDLYFKYLGQNREAVESLKDAIYERKGLEDEWRHSKISYKKPPIPADRIHEHMRMRIEEVRAYMQDITDDLDDEEKERRSAEWSEWSDQREAAFNSGSNWDQIQRPEWVKSSSN